MIEYLEGWKSVFGLIDGVGICVDRATHIQWPLWEKQLETKTDVFTREASCFYDPSYLLSLLSIIKVIFLTNER